MPISEDSESDNDMDDDDLDEKSRGINWHSIGESLSTLDKDVETLRLLLEESHQELYTRCLFIAWKNYAPADEVFIRYLDVSNFQLLLQYEFMIPFSKYDTVLVKINVPHHDHLREMKLDLQDGHSIQARMCIKKSHSCRNYFIVKNVESSCVKGLGISIPLRAFSRVVCCTSPQGSRIPSPSSLTLAASPTLSGKFARRMLDRDLLSQYLQILRSASAWLKNYCEALKV
nr:hypothetical protein [Tanacetum cinerariifolium]GEY40844.1 hypothetical protein [Tanacetum cinerariifolium]